MILPLRGRSTHELTFFRQYWWANLHLNIQQAWLFLFCIWGMDLEFITGLLGLALQLTYALHVDQYCALEVLKV